MNFGKPVLVIVVAVADNGVIGTGGTLPWNISSDLKRVKSLTVGKPLIMGRRTYESIGRPLPNRKTIVLTTDKNFSVPGVSVYATFSKAYESAIRMAVKMESDEVIAFGGAEIYKKAIPLAQKIYKTEIHYSPVGDIHFPEYRKSDWRETEREYFSRTEGDSSSYSFVCLQRV